MAEHTESQKTKTTNQRRDQQFKEFSVSVVTKQQFYQLIKLLNHSLGHGRKNWYISGRPLRKIQRYSTFNHTALSLMQSNSIVADKIKPRPVVLKLNIRSDLESKLTKVFLEFESDKYCF